MKKRAGLVIYAIILCIFSAILVSSVPTIDKVEIGGYWTPGITSVNDSVIKRTINCSAIATSSSNNLDYFTSFDLMGGNASLYLAQDWKINSQFLDGDYKNNSYFDFKPDNQGNFYFLNKNHLEKINGETGAVLWEKSPLTNLFSKNFAISPAGIFVENGEPYVLYYGEWKNYTAEPNVYEEFYFYYHYDKDGNLVWRKDYNISAYIPSYWTDKITCHNAGSQLGATHELIKDSLNSEGNLFCLQHIQNIGGQNSPLYYPPGDPGYLEWKNWVDTPKPMKDFLVKITPNNIEVLAEVASGYEKSLSDGYPSVGFGGWFGYGFMDSNSFFIVTYNYTYYGPYPANVADKRSLAKYTLAGELIWKKELPHNHFIGEVPLEGHLSALKDESGKINGFFWYIPKDKSESSRNFYQIEIFDETLNLIKSIKNSFVNAAPIRNFYYYNGQLFFGDESRIYQVDSDFNIIKTYLLPRKLATSRTSSPTAYFDLSAVWGSVFYVDSINEKIYILRAEALQDTISFSKISGYFKINAPSNKKVNVAGLKEMFNSGGWGMGWVNLYNVNDYIDFLMPKSEINCIVKAKDSSGFSESVSSGFFNVYSICANGMINSDAPYLEKCDDRNINNGDGCSASCKIETGWFCSGEPSVCVRVGSGACGDGVCDSAESVGVCSDCQCDGTNSCMESVIPCTINQCNLTSKRCELVENLSGCEAGRGFILNLKDWVLRGIAIPKNLFDSLVDYLSRYLP